MIRHIPKRERVSDGQRGETESLRGDEEIGWGV
jgi:hypothetical protein